jgi:hypothetical protein
MEPSEDMEPSEVEGAQMKKHPIFSMSIAKVYPLLAAKAQKNGRSIADVNEIIRWLTGYSQHQIERHLHDGTSYEDFFVQAPQMNPRRTLITGVVCGIRIENIEDPIMREIRYLDKMIDELAKGKAMDKILRS